MIGSNSAGNAYVLYNDAEALLIECGVHIKKIKEAVGFDMGKIVAALVSHNHGDHCKAVREVLAAGVEVYASPGTMSAMGVQDHHRAHTVEPMESFKVGGFTVMGFDVKHDAIQPYGFLITHPECGLTLFLTDSYFVPYTFPELNNILVEVNYADDILDEKVAAGKTHSFLRERVMGSHMSLQTCKDLLLANDLSQVNNVLLIHLSDSNADEKRFISEIHELTGKTVMAATKGMDIEFNRTPF